ncbi:MAG: leucine-rich repeat domain-containing protein [Treponema sp.]|jgi:hypothetical protein|nr:leucine-rich repeat domain-containing protein [Treponema sp.]
MRSEFETAVANGQVTITGYHGDAQDVHIPDQINGLPVTAIGEEAFAEMPLTSVTIPNSVTNIGYGAFANTRLTSVTIPNSVTNIGDSTFDDDVEIIRVDDGSKKSLSMSPVLTV